MTAHEHSPERSTNEISYRVSADGVIEEIGGPWEEFARANAAPELAEPPVGRRLDGFITGASTRGLIRKRMAKVRVGARAIEVSYRCDGPDCRRFMRLRIEPGDDGSLLFRSCILREEPRARVPLMEFRAPRSANLIKMCAWCNRFEVDDGWLEVEDAVEKLKLFDVSLPPDISHGVCPACEEDVQKAV